MPVVASAAAALGAVVVVEASRPCRCGCGCERAVPGRAGPEIGAAAAAEGGVSDEEEHWLGATPIAEAEVDGEEAEREGK